MKAQLCRDFDGMVIREWETTCIPSVGESVYLEFVDENTGVPTFNVYKVIERAFYPDTDEVEIMLQLTSEV